MFCGPENIHTSITDSYLVDNHPASPGISRVKLHNFPFKIWISIDYPRWQDMGILWTRKLQMND